MQTTAAPFRGLIDLASAQFGGRIVFANDAFFGAPENLLQPGRGVWIDGKFTNEGKWVDGWETRRKRTPGHDHCIIELGAEGFVSALDIDTNHFSGNHPPFASVDGVVAAKGTTDFSAAVWQPVLRQSALSPSCQNFFVCEPGTAYTHLRLNIFPDGGVARFRAYGRVGGTWPAADIDADTARHVDPSFVDLAAAKNGGLALACSDAFFGPMNNLLMPGRAATMGEGWETRRKRQPGHDWILLKLAARGLPRVFEIDTRYFKGNFPDRCTVEAIDNPGAPVTELMTSDAWWSLLPATPLGADARHYIAVSGEQAVSHVRVNIFPDGGISRFRTWGLRA
jgi:allantoicase